MTNISTGLVSSPAVPELSAPSLLPISFEDGRYSYRGNANTSSTFGNVSKRLSDAVNTLLRTKHFYTRTNAGYGFSDYTGLDGSGYVFFLWLMEGETALTYGECADAIDRLARYVENHPPLQWLSMGVMISVDNKALIKCGLFTEVGNNVEIDVHEGDIHALGDLYPRRRLNKQGVRAALRALENEDDWRQEHLPQPAFVPEPTTQEYVRQDVPVRIELKLGDEGVWPEIEYRELSDLMAQVQRYFLGTGVWAELYADLWADVDEGSADIGYMTIQRASHDIRPSSGQEGPYIAVA